MKPFSERFNQFIDDWFAQNKDKFELYEKSLFNFDDIEETFKRFTAHYRQHKTIPMWFDDNRDNIFGDTVINAKFRAWHDWTHIHIGADFTLMGEWRTYMFQQSSLPWDWEYERKLMWCEVLEQAKHYSGGGKTIENQREFTERYLKQ